VEALALRPEDRFLEVEAPDFSPGGRAFKPAENTPLLKLRALALVASPQAVETCFRLDLNINDPALAPP